MTPHRHFGAWSEPPTGLPRRARGGLLRRVSAAKCDGPERNRWQSLTGSPGRWIVAIGCGARADDLAAGERSKQRRNPSTGGSQVAEVEGLGSVRAALIR